MHRRIPLLVMRLHSSLEDRSCFRNSSIYTVFHGYNFPPVHLAAGVFFLNYVLAFV